MRKARFTEHQIIAVLKSVEAGRAVKDVCREACIFEASYLMAQFAMSLRQACRTLSLSRKIYFYPLDTRVMDR